MFIHSSILLITWAWDYSKSQLWSFRDGKLDHPHDGEYHCDEDDVDDDDDGLGDGEDGGDHHEDNDDDDDDGVGNGDDGEGHHEDDGGGIRRQEGGGEELQNVSNCIAHSLHRLPDRYSL